MNDILRLTGPLMIQAAAAGQRQPRASILAYAGGSMSTAGWKNIVIDLAGADIGGNVPLLASHVEGLDAIVGQGTASVRSGQLFVEGPVAASTPAGQQVLALAREGIQLQASIGYAPGKVERIPAGQSTTANGRTFTAGPQGLTIVRSGRLREVSLLPVGADPDTQVTIAASGKKGTSMETNETISTAPEQPVTTARERIQAAWNATNWYCDAHDDGPKARARDAMIRAAAGEISESDYREMLAKEQLADRNLYIIRAERPKAPPVCNSRGDAGSTPKVLEAALLRHMGHENIAEKRLGANTIQAAADLGCTSLVDIIRAGFRMEGRDVPTNHGEMIRAAFSTLSLPGILSNAANKMMLEAYQAVPSVARLVARKLSAKDFKDHTGFRLTGDMVFEQLGPDGKIQHGQLSESAFDYRVDTFARMFALSRKDMINDDLGAFDSMPQIVGRGAALRLEDLFWALVLANTGGFFSAANGNYIDGASTFLSLEGLRQAVEAMRKQTDKFGAPILVEPKILVVPPELELVADALYSSTNVVVAVASGSTTEAIPDSNSYKGKYQPHVAPHLSNDTYANASATGWYLFGAPTDVAAFGIAYLNGAESPTVEMEDADFSTLGVQLRGYIDIGVCQVDPCGGVMSKGKA